MKEMCRAPWSSISFIVNYCGTRVLLNADAKRMLKETEKEEARLFCQIFVIAGILLVAPLPPLATPMILR